MRTESLQLLKRYTDARIALSESVPDSAKFRAASNTSVVLQILASALALGVLGTFLASHEHGVFMALLAATLVTVMLLVIFDLDRPQRGLITISDAALVGERASMNGPPAATGPP